MGSQHMRPRLVIGAFSEEDVTSETVALLPRRSTAPPKQRCSAILARFYHGSCWPPGSGGRVRFCACDQCVHRTVGAAVGFGQSPADVVGGCGGHGHLCGDRDRANLTGSGILFFCWPGCDSCGYSNRRVGDRNPGRLVDAGGLATVEPTYPVVIDWIAGRVKTW